MFTVHIKSGRDEDPKSIKNCALFPFFMKDAHFFYDTEKKSHADFVVSQSGTSQKKEKK